MKKLYRYVKGGELVLLYEGANPHREETSELRISKRGVRTILMGWQMRYSGLDVYEDNYTYDITLGEWWRGLFA